MNKCNLNGCEREKKAQGFCLMHYKQAKRYEARVARGQEGFTLPEWAKETDLAYAAGYVDADGTVTLATTKSSSTVHGITFYPHVSAVSIDIDSVQFLQKLLGGKVGTREPRGTNVKANHPIHHWYTGGKRAGWVAGILEPYLKIKAPQARAVYEFYFCKTWTQSVGMANAMPEEEFQRRLRLVEAVKYRNQRKYLPSIKHGDDVWLEIRNQ